MAIVYQHRRLDTNEVFYIGIGKEKNRAYSKLNRNKYWKNIVNNYGYDIDILIDGCNWDNACEIERGMINSYGRWDLGKGQLVNMTDGGEGILGARRSEETKNKQSLSAIGNKNGKGNKGNHISEEAKKKMSLAKLGKPSNRKNYVTTEETKNKISNTLKGNIPWNKGKKTGQIPWNKGKKNNI
jgi:hypothetical protein